MPERIRGSYDDALYKSTYTLLLLLLLLVKELYQHHWHFAAGCRQLARQRHRRDVCDAVGWTIEERVSSATWRREFGAAMCACLGTCSVSAPDAASSHCISKPERIEAARSHMIEWSQSFAVIKLDYLTAVCVLTASASYAFCELWRMWFTIITQEIKLAFTFESVRVRTLYI